MKHRFFVFIFLFLATFYQAHSQVGINTDEPNNRAVLDLNSPTNDQGLLVPRLSTIQRTAIAFTSGLSASENGLLIFDTDDKLFYYWMFPSWKAIEAGAHSTIWRSGTDLPENSTGEEGDFYLNVVTGNVYRKHSGSYELNFNIKGEPGPQGVQGVKGDAGIQGIQGLKGDIGEKGEVGPQGPVGLTGATGLAGPQGLKGDTGDTGPVGPQGPEGPAGATGAQGTQGLKGDIGEKGEVGPQGPVGPVGATGPAGPQGLKGDIGETGPAGPQGPEGPAGATGAPGIQGLKGDIGEKGEVGAQGPVGPVGATGLAGPQGLKGDTGEIGPAGPQGPEGAAGATGAQGIQGLKGDIGEKGEVGPQGPAGPIGATGAAGPQGPIGLTGPQGEPGISTSFNARSVNSSYTATAADDVIIAMNGGTTITLPSAGSVPGKVYHIRHNLGLLDLLGSVTIAAPAGNSIIDGSAAQTFTIGLLNPTAITVIAVDTNKWYVIGKF